MTRSSQERLIRRRSGAAANSFVTRIKGQFAVELRAALDELASIGGFSIDLSQRAQGSPAIVKQELASFVHAKLCAHSRSIGAIFQSSMFDHSALLAVSRMIIEGLTMIIYLLEVVPPDIWSLRYSVLRLHDTVSRIKFLRVNSDDISDLKNGRLQLIDEIKSNPQMSSFTTAQQTKLLSGEEVFVGGMRKAAESAGWDADVFTSTYSFFSVHAHTSPQSFFRARLQKVDYYNPSDAQVALACSGLSVATGCLRRASLRYLDHNPEAENWISSEFLIRVRKDDLEEKVFRKPVN